MGGWNSIEGSEGSDESDGDGNTLCLSTYREVQSIHTKFQKHINSYAFFRNYNFLELIALYPLL